MSSSLELETVPSDVAEADRGSLGHGIFETLAFRGFGLPLSFGISVVTSRCLLPVGRGAFVLGLLTVTLAAALLGNVGTAVVHEVSRDRESARVLLARAVLVSILLGIAGAAVLAPIDLALAQQDYRVVTFAVLGLAPLLVAQTVGTMLLALGRLRLWNVLQLLLPATTLACMLVLVLALSKGVTGAIWSWVLGQGAAALVALVATRDLWWPLPPQLLRLDRFRPLLVLGLRIGVVNLVSLVNYRIELIILETYRGLNGVGIYSLATSLAELLWLVSSAVSTVLVATAVRGSDRRAVDVVAAGVRHVLLATTVLAALLAAVSHWVVPAVFGPRFAPSVTPLLILLPGVVAFAPGTVLAVFFTMRMGRARYSFAAALVSAAITGILAIVLIPWLGVEGAALACTIGYASSITVALVWFARLAHVSPRDFAPRRSDVAVYRSAARRLVHR